MTQSVASAPLAELEIELLYLDLDTCDPCRTARSSLDEAIAELSQALADSGHRVNARLTHVTDPAQAEALGFVSSPTVRVSGADIALTVEEAHCGTCSTVAREPIAGRTFEHAGRRYSHPPAQMIVDAVLAHVAGAATADSPAVGRTAGTSVRRFLDARKRAQAIDELRARMRGELLAPGDADWDAARGAYNTVVDQRPALIALPESAQDVVAVVNFAGAQAMQIVPQRTGHNAEPLGSIDHTILLRTDRMRQVAIDPIRRRALVGAGAKWENVVPAASDMGLAALHGSTPDVSIAGYMLGGGVGWYGRKLGLATNNVAAIEIVTADGRLRWVGHDHEPELFWALRGGGGNFGVVTALEIELFPIPELYAGILFFPWERSAEVLKVWHAWTKTVPDETTSVGRIMQFPPTDGIPAPLSGHSFVMVEAFHLGTEAEGTELLRPLRELGPVLDTFAVIPPVGLAEIHMDPRDPLPYATDHRVLASLTDDSIDDLVAAVGPDADSELISVEIRHLGGAMGRTAPDHGALAKLPGEYIVFGIGVTPDDEAGHAVRARLKRMIGAMSHLASGLYFNFTEHEVDPAEIYPADTYQRLQAVRADVDPHGIFRANHSIPAQARR